MEKIIICADVIAEYSGKIVLIKRLNGVPGLALPGGKQEANELLSDTARREFLEETGMRLEIIEVLGTFAEDDRDPRGRFISTVFTGRAIGDSKDEPGKTEVILLDKRVIPWLKEKFLFDHWEILERYLKRRLP